MSINDGGNSNSRRRHRSAWWRDEMQWSQRGRPSPPFLWGTMRNRFRRGIIFFLIGWIFFMVMLVTGLGFLVTWIFGSFHLPSVILIIGRPLGIFVGLFLIFSIFRGVWLFRRSTFPLGDLIEGVGRVAEGDYSTRLEENGSADMRNMASAFNSMAEKLQNNDEQRRRLLADVTHELRTPITVIQGNLEGMIDGIYPSDPEHIQTVLEETRLMSHIIDDLRTLSLTESGALTLERERSSISDLVREVIRSYESASKTAGVNLVDDLAPDLPDLEIDPTRIREVLENLVANALRYTPSGGTIAIRTWLQDAQAIGIEVSDSGKGISPDDLAHIFDRFYKSADSRGTGLGLAIAKSLIIAHGGEIHAERFPVQGTRIWFTLPIPPVS